jgi:sorbitol/mannitol transport system permease protein
MILALLTYRPFFGVGVVRTFLITPFFITDAVIGVYWRNVMLGATYGFLPKIFSNIGIKFPDLLAQYPLILIIILISWKWTPFFMLVLTAGLQGIPDEIIEASYVDGANYWMRTTRIITPMLRPHIVISLMLGLIFMLKTFGLIFTSTHGGPGYASTNFPYYVYRTALMGWDVGKGAAIAIFIVIISLIIINFVFKILGKTLKEAS